MKFLSLLLVAFSILILPAFAQSQQNPSLIVQTIDVSPSDFNTVSRDTVIVQLDKPHAISWQITIRNELIYANPDGDAVVRFYDLDDPEKFIEIGMGSPPAEKFWIAVMIPDDTGYVVVNSKQDRGWNSNSNQILAYTEKSGLTVNNGERIVISNLDVGSFKIGSYSVFGMESSTDPPAINSGSFTMEILSGDPSQNPILLYPFYLAGGIGILVGLLLVFKKRN